MNAITNRELNRTLLHRQRLLEPSEETALEIVRNVAGLQAQEGPAPYFGLWARSKNFKRNGLDALRESKQIVRCTLQRRTVHMVTVEDYKNWQPLYQNRIEKEIDKWGEPFTNSSQWLPELQKMLGSTSHTNATVRDELQKLFAQYADLAHTRFALMAGLGLVRVPGVGGESLGPKEPWIVASEYLKYTPTAGDVKMMVRSYLNAFGPATIGDMSYWSGLTSLRSVFDSMKDELWMGKNENGKILYDVEDAQRLTGDEDVQKVQLLADFDNVILGHQDRTRIISDEFRARMNKDIRSMNPMLIDGMFAGIWKIRKKSATTTATLIPFQQLGKTQKQLLENKAIEGLIMWQPTLTPSVLWE